MLFWKIHLALNKEKKMLQVDLGLKDGMHIFCDLTVPIYS